MVKFVGMSGIVQVKCPKCIAVDTPGTILKFYRETGRSGCGAQSSREAALLSITFILRRSLTITCIVAVKLLDRLLAQVVVKLSMEWERAMVSIAIEWERAVVPG
eukprot:1552895-Ditylum_brightwellii.AAC.2